MRSVSVFCHIVCVAAMVCAQEMVLSTDAAELQLARSYLQKYPLIDTHLDTIQTFRMLSRKPVEMIKSLAKDWAGHWDIARARQGGQGAAFFTVWAPCPDLVNVDVGPDFLVPDNTVRDTMEMADLIRETIEWHNDLEYVETADAAEDAFLRGKIASFLGCEGAHMLGNSISMVRILYRLGVRYLTLAHMCHNAFASYAGGATGIVYQPRPGHNGLTSLGKALVKEMNRIGMMVDLSHTSEETMMDAMDISESPVIFTHSGARNIYDTPRNVPESVLDRIASGERSGLIQSVLVSKFAGPPGNQTLYKVIDHVEYIASRIGRDKVGLASDFDGTSGVVQGMEDVSKWPYMVAEFIHRGWNETEIRGLVGGNLLRTMREVEAVAASKIDSFPSSDIFEKRTDLPSTLWAGEGGAFLAPKLRQKLVQHVRDEL